MSSDTVWMPDIKELKQKYDESLPHLQVLLNRIEEHLRSLIQVSAILSYKARIKKFESFYKKLLKYPPKAYTQELPVLTDLIGLRIICPFIQNIREVKTVLTDNFKILEIEEKGAERTFREFGYESTHVLIEIPDNFKVGLCLPPDLIFEIQIRTILQDAWAEVEHELVYKYEFSPLDIPLKRKLASINASLCLADVVFQDLRDYQGKLNSQLDTRRNHFYAYADTFTDAVLVDDTKRQTESSFVYTNMESLETIDSLILHALEAHNTGDFSLAQAIYTKIIEKQTNPLVQSIMYKHRGMAFFAEGNYQCAYRDFCNSIEANPENFRAYYYAGIVLMIMGNDYDAIDYFTKSLKLNGYQAHVYFRRALAYFREKQFAFALSDLDKASALGLPHEDEKKLRVAIAKKIDIV